MLVLKRKEFTSRETKDFMLSRFPSTQVMDVGAFHGIDDSLFRKYGYHHVKDMTDLYGKLSEHSKLAKDEISLNKYLNKPLSQRLEGFKASKGKRLQIPTDDKTKLLGKRIFKKATGKI